VRGPGPSLLILPHLDRWASQWDQLVDASPLPSPFLRSWWLIGTGGPRPRFLLVVEDDRLLGGLALEEGRRLGLPCLHMMGAGPLCPDHLDLLAVPGQEEAVVRAVRDWLRRPGTRLLSLEGVHAGSRLVTAVPGHVRREALAVAPWAPLPADAGTYLAARPAGFRKTLRRASARMTAAGTTHRINRGRSAVRSLGRLRQLHRAQWEDRSRFLPAFDRFTAACRLAADFDEVSVHELAVGETVIAIMVTFEVAGRVSLYQSARLTDFRWRDATTVLLAAIISDACRRGFAEVDFLRGDETYKSNFASERRELLRLRGASSLTGQAALVAETAARQARLMARSAQESWRARDRHPKARRSGSLPCTRPLSPSADLPATFWPRCLTAHAGRVPRPASQPLWPRQ
jgi:CelD/BcsL family acetyltransferase involved in cellulose biosynthesis